MADPDPVPPAITIPEKAVLVQPESPRTDADVWDDRMRMFGAILIAVLLITLAAYMAVEAPDTKESGAVIGSFVTAIPIVVRYFMKGEGT